MPEGHKYTAEQIQVLEGLEPVRKRPGMYIGSTDTAGLHHCLYEIVDNAIDEAMGGHCTEVLVALHDTGSVSVEDNGRGIPVDVHKQTKRPALETVLTTLHAGGKFGGDKSGYKVSGGLHGVGASVVNALAEWMRADVYRDGKIHVQEYRRGKPTADMRTQGKTEKHGTRIEFRPDPEIFDSSTRGKDGKSLWSLEVILTRLRQQAYLTRGIDIRVIDERKDRPLEDQKYPRIYRFRFEGGIAAYVAHINETKEPIGDVIWIEQDTPEGMVEIALQYSQSFQEHTLTFANTIFTAEGGAHLTGFKAALTRTINAYARAQTFLKEKEENLTADDVREGLTAVVSIRLREPQFEGQTKAKLGNAEIKTAVETVVNERLATYLEEHPSEAKAIIGKCLLASRARLAARAARDSVIRKGALEGMTLPGKLADCSCRDPKDCELYIVEGESAGGCFAPETVIKLASGKEKTIRQLAEDWEHGISHFGYATNEQGDIRIVPLVHPRVTKKNAQLVEVELDNGATLRCTRDHLFRLRDGSYHRADQLTKGQSLMPLKVQFTDDRAPMGAGYEMVWMNGQEKWVHTHHLADLWNLWMKRYRKSDGAYRHHIDFDKRNNDPRNLRRMTKEDHTELHAGLASDHFKTLWRDPGYRRQKIEQASATAKRQWRDPAYREYMRGCARKQRENPVMTKAVMDGFQKWFHSLSPEEYEAYCRRSQDMFAAYWSKGEHRNEQSKRTRGHFERHPEARKYHRALAKEQWSNERLREWRARKTREHWQDEEYRENHSRKVRAWWEKHPEHAEQIRAARERTWNDPQARARIADGLARWRASTSSEQKAVCIREGKKIKALALLKAVLDRPNIEAAFQHLRRQQAPTSIGYARLLSDYYGGDESALLAAARNVNCKVVSIRFLQERSDVYDLTVEKYHNFALGAGIFVHNSAKQGRNREFQAILPLKGKILNVEQARLDKILANSEIKALIVALGVGVGEVKDVSKLRYDRIIIMTDADVDGAHIRTLLLTFFYRYYAELIEEGHLYIAQPPLFKIAAGKEVRYAFSDAEREKILKELGAGTKESEAREAREAEEAKEEGGGELEGDVVEEGKGKKTRRVLVQRYKGLGEMNPEQLWETTMDPKVRIMSKVTVEDAERADATFSVLMGDEVAPRRKFIQTKAKAVKNLDI